MGTGRGANSEKAGEAAVATAAILTCDRKFEQVVAKDDQEVCVKRCIKKT